MKEEEKRVVCSEGVGGRLRRWLVVQSEVEPRGCAARSGKILGSVEKHGNCLGLDADRWNR